MAKKTSLRSMAVNAPKEAPEAPTSNVERHETENSKAMSLRVPPALWKELQLRKIDEGRAVNTIVIDAIEQYLKRAGGKS